MCLLNVANLVLLFEHYRKPMHAGLYSNWYSFVPWYYKRNLANSLLKRVYEISSSNRIMNEDFQRIKTICLRLPNSGSSNLCMWLFELSQKLYFIFCFYYKVLKYCKMVLW